MLCRRRTLAKRTRGAQQPHPDVPPRCCARGHRDRQRERSGAITRQRTCCADRVVCASKCGAFDHKRQRACSGSSVARLADLQCDDMRRSVDHDPLCGLHKRDSKVVVDNRHCGLGDAHEHRCRRHCRSDLELECARRVEPVVVDQRKCQRIHPCCCAETQGWQVVAVEKVEIAHCSARDLDARRARRRACASQSDSDCSWLLVNADCGQREANLKVVVRDGDCCGRQRERRNDAVAAAGLVVCDRAQRHGEHFVHKLKDLVVDYRNRQHSRLRGRCWVDIDKVDACRSELNVGARCGASHVVLELVDAESG
eukprot:comp22444_c0_seq1/m.55129 comp22444_c0_seq1/g.55129  ORF comp22444_c0_seq1/g.55129 comp22444_c0_seq1/m.55129 type:complete len:312 (-) comp22444_c0_seq1:946-1881(-)